MATEETQGINLVVITGMSGAGKTVAMQSLEDLGFFCIDNLPPVLLGKLVELLEQSNGMQKAAIVIDLRGRDFFSSLFESLDRLEQHHGIQYRILYFDASDEILVQRYKETRRRHPLSSEGTPMDGIQTERKLLDEIRGRAHQIIDTSGMKPNQLKERIISRFPTSVEKSFPITFQSFGFKYGVPIDADLIFDVRFLPNPHYVESLKPRTGKEKEVYEYVMKWEETKQFLEKLTDLLTFLFPHYQREGKASLVVGIGCTGGKHRSVALVEYLKNWFQEKESSRAAHRDIEKH